MLQSCTRLCETLIRDCLVATVPFSRWADRRMEELVRLMAHNFELGGHEDGFVAAGEGRKAPRASVGVIELMHGSHQQCMGPTATGVASANSSARELTKPR
jgi:hypothetical protein